MLFNDFVSKFRGNRKANYSSLSGGQVAASRQSSKIFFADITISNCELFPLKLTTSLCIESWGVRDDNKIDNYRLNTTSNPLSPFRDGAKQALLCPQIVRRSHTRQKCESMYAWDDTTFLLITATIRLPPDSEPPTNARHNIMVIISEYLWSHIA